jgi:uncharacterized GH25 family protein
MRIWHNLKRCLLAWLLLGSMLAPACAHDIWITTEPLAGGDNFCAALHYGHPGDLSLPEPSRLLDFGVYDHAGHEHRLVSPLLAQLTTLSQNTDAIEPHPGPQTAVFYASYDNGFWTKTPDGVYHNTTLELHPEAIESVRSLKFAKYLGAPTSTTVGYERVVGHELELVPLDNPFTLKQGDELHVQVLYHGRPLTGVGVEIGDGVTARKEEEIPRYKTNGHGIAQVPISHPGLQLLAVDYAAPYPYPALAKRWEYSATLAFTLK